MKYNNYHHFLDEFESRIKASNFDDAWEDMLEESLDSDQDFLFRIDGKALYNLSNADPEYKAIYEAMPPVKLLEIQQPGIKRDDNTDFQFSGTVYKKKLAIDLAQQLRPHPEVEEENGNGVLYCITSFKNWGQTVNISNVITFVPKTKAGVCNIVKWCKTNGKRVRAAGYRHTWPSLYGQEDHVIISTLDLAVAQTLPASHPPMDPANQLQGIKIIGTTPEGIGLCQIGAAVTNEQFRKWCITAGGGNNQWTLPLNVIMVEITLGGSNSPMCHGAGKQHQTLSDLVESIEFVNANGELQTVNDPTMLKAAAGCLGMLGIVTSMVIKLDPMTYAKMTPEKKDVVLTIPPPQDIPIPRRFTNYTDALKKTAWDEFVKQCDESYYSEWFWFPNRKRCWINCWKNDGDKNDAVEYPSPRQARIQEYEEYLAHLLNENILRYTPRLQTAILSGFAMAAMPNNQLITTALINALHFRRGIQNMRVLDMEMEIPIPARADDPTKPDYTICQQAWWAVLTDYYNRPNLPMRIALEMRIMKDSEMLIAPEFGNKFGTCSIEVLTVSQEDPQEWLNYMQDITDKWMAIKDHYGNALNVRPHWAKQWEGLSMNGKPAVSYLKDAYATQIPAYKAQLAAIALAGGYSLQDCQQRFSNPLLDDMFAEVYS